MRQQQEGFTLIEVVVTLGIAGAIGVVILMMITTLILNSPKLDNQQIALQQVKNAGYWMPRDINMARDVTLGGPDGFPLTIDIPIDQDVNNDYSVEYLFVGDNLKRKQRDESGSLIAETLVAQYVDTGNTVFDEIIPDDLYELTIRVSVGGEAVTANYTMESRLALD